MINDEEKFIQEVIKVEGLKYIAGYVAHKFKIKYPFLGTQIRRLELNNYNPDWIQYLSDGYLTYPCDDLIAIAKVMEKEFLDCHGKFRLSNETGIFKKVTNIVKEKISVTFNIPDEVISCLIRTRTYIRL